MEHQPNIDFRLAAEVFPQNSVLSLEGVFLVKRKSVTFGLLDHYGLVITPKHLNPFRIWSDRTQLLHKTDVGVIVENFDWYQWQILYKVPDSQIPDVVVRAEAASFEPYDLIMSNCEHWAREAATGSNTSSQVWNGVLWTAMVGTIIYFSSDRNH